MATSKLQNDGSINGSVTYGNGVYSSIFKNEIRRTGNVVTVLFSGKIASSIAGTNGTICTLPELFRPPAANVRNIYIRGKYDNNSGTWSASIKGNDGTIQTVTGASDFTDEIYVDCTFII